MGHEVRLFVGHPNVLLRYRTALSGARIHTLVAGAALAVLSMNDDIQDALHKAYGTGEWLDDGAGLTTTDLAFAARASETGALAYIETAYFGGSGRQSAVLWFGGDVTIKPTSLESTAAEP
jgi:hypothetical protein